MLVRLNAEQDTPKRQTEKSLSGQLTTFPDSVDSHLSSVTGSITTYEMTTLGDFVALAHAFNLFFRKPNALFLCADKSSRESLHSRVCGCRTQAAGMATVGTIGVD